LPSGSSRLFSASVDVLDQELDQFKGQYVLIARVVSNGKLHAVERVQHRIYALCRLGDWVTEEDLRALSRLPPVACSQSPSVDSRQPASSGRNAPWWLPTMIEKGDVNESEDLVRPLLRARKLLKVDSGHNEDGNGSRLPQDVNATVPRAESADISVQIPQVASEPVEAGFAQQTPEEVFEKVRRQYLETLYISKVCLFHFKVLIRC
jgi:DNA replication regulator SLD3